MHLLAFGHFYFLCPECLRPTFYTQLLPVPHPKSSCPDLCMQPAPSVASWLRVGAGGPACVFTQRSL